MKQLGAFLLCFFIIILFPPAASAHLSGQPPFFKINGIYSTLYPVASSSLNDFILPQDLAPENYLVNQPLDFEIKVDQLQVPSEVVKRTTFTWDFADGAKGGGLKNTHAYTKIGSYILIINSEYEENGTKYPPQLFQSVILHVLPNKNYKLPKAVIKVNGKHVGDPVMDILEFPKGTAYAFDASDSKAPSSTIASYFWDLGDTNASADKIVKHHYADKMAIVLPLLRIKDANGFIADDFVQINTQKLEKETTTLKRSYAIKKDAIRSAIGINYPLLAGVALLIISIFFWVFIRRIR